VNDPARMATAYAGVATVSDGNNHIIIRGNTPNGLLWRMEGVEIPNPNHFSSVGTAGGGISILSAQLLSNSDFITGAFAAEYGNALSGVFDLKLRKGNSERREYTFQAGVLGLDASTEGPLNAGGSNGSYLFNYRYSTLSILGKLGIDFGDATTNFQDLSFNIWLPTKRIGQFTLFGIGGLSDQSWKGKPDSAEWKLDGDTRYTGTFTANTGIAGLTHQLAWEKTFLKTVLSVSGTRNGEFEDEYDKRYQLKRIDEERHLQMRYTLSSVLSHKFNARNYLRAGFYINHLNFDLKERFLNRDQEKYTERLKSEGDGQVLNAFAQWQYRPTERLTLNVGVHGLYFFLNNTYSAEPRAALKYAFSDRQSVSFGYGLHSQIQPLGVYFGKPENQPGEMPNADLDLTKSQHFVLGFDQMLTRQLHLKTEVYFQDLFDVPVSRDFSNTFSMLNKEDGFVTSALKNSGKGRNYGFELTFEQFLNKGLYFLLSTSLFESKYRGSDGVWRNTRYNTNYVVSSVAGKEWNWNRRGKNRTFGVNLKLTASGGLRETPLNYEASRSAGRLVFDSTRAFEDQMPGYFRADVGFRIKRNYAHLTSTFGFDVQNVTNRANVFGQEYTPTLEKTYSEQAPLIPILYYRIEF
jgi:TonB dependent receptor